MTENTARRLGRPTLQEASALQEAILGRAFTMLCERGLHGFSVEALAKLSGVTKRTIYRHYKSKAVLIEAVVERQVVQPTDVSMLPDMQCAPIDRLREWSWLYFQHISRADTSRIGLLLRLASSSEPWAAEMLRGWIGRVLQASRSLIDVAQASGDLRPGGLDELAALLLDLMDAYAMRALFLDVDQLVEPAEALAPLFQSRWLAFLHLARPDWRLG